MRNIGYLAYALGYWGMAAIPTACSSGSGNGVEGGEGGLGTGGAAYNNVGGSVSIGGNYFGRTSTGTSTGGSNSLSTQCAQEQVPIEPTPPDILIVMDQSLSMTRTVDNQVCTGGTTTGNANCGTDSRWYKTIVAVQAVVNATQSKVNWGLFYLGNEATQCGAATAPAVPITLGESYPLIEQSFAAVAFTGAAGTPTASAIKNAVSYMRTVSDDNPKYLLLATDGEPNCAGGTLMTGDATGAANAIASARTAGFDTFVVGIATDTDSAATSALNLAAQAGGHPQTGAATEYYAVNDTATLEAALTQIVSIAASCTISLANTPKGEWTVAISATNPDGQTVEIPSDPNDGWAYTDATRTSISLLGSSCEGLKNGEYTNFNFVFTCLGSNIVW
jgi:hypothetical protein